MVTMGNNPNPQSLQFSVYKKGVNHLQSDYKLCVHGVRSYEFIVIFGRLLGNTSRGLLQGQSTQ